MDIIRARYYFNTQNNDSHVKFIYPPDNVVRETPKCYYTKHCFRYRKADIDVVKLRSRNGRPSYLEVIVIDKSDEEIANLFSNWFENDIMIVTAGEKSS